MNDYSGPSIDATIDPSQTLNTSSYGDGSSWQGYIFDFPITLNGTNIVGNGPIVVISQQSSDPTFADGVNSNGLMGVAYSQLASKRTSPATVFDAWVDSKAVAKDEIAFHGCPYSLQSQSWIDFGNDNPFTDCGSQSARIKMPKKSYYNVDLQQVSIDGVNSPFPSNFQVTQYSVLDSCTSVITLPTTVASQIQDAIKSSNAFSTAFKDSSVFQDWVNGDISLKLKSSDIDFGKLPSLTFVLASGHTDYSSVTLVLGPRQYIQIDSDGFCNRF